MADVAFDATNSGINTTNNPTCVVAITVGTLDHGVLEATVKWIVTAGGGVRLPSSVASDIGGQFERIDGTRALVLAADAADWGTEKWLLRNPAPGSHSVTLTMNGNTQVKHLGLQSYSLVDHSHPIRAVAVASGTATTNPVTITVPGTRASDMVSGALLSDAASASADVAVNSPATQRWETEEQVFEGDSAAGGDLVASTGSTGIAFTRGSTNFAFVGSAVALKALDSTDGASTGPGIVIGAPTSFVGEGAIGATDATGGGGQTIAVGQVTETDVAQPISWAPKNRFVNLATETDLAQAVTRRKTLAIGQASETDAAQPVVATKRKALGQTSETDLAQAVAHEKARALGQATETDLAQAVAVVSSNVVAVGQASETDLAQPVGRLKAKVLGQATETDSAQTVTPIAGTIVIGIGQATETDAAQAVLWAPKIRIIGQAAEADSALAVTPIIVGAGGARPDGARRAKRRPQIPPEFLPPEESPATPASVPAAAILAPQVARPPEPSPASAIVPVLAGAMAALRAPAPAAVANQPVAVARPAPGDDDDEELMLFH
jgi:hypothetical protein